MGKLVSKLSQVISGKVGLARGVEKLKGFEFLQEAPAIKEKCWALGIWGKIRI